MRNRQKIHKHLLYTSWYLRLVKILKAIKIRGGKASLYRILIIFIDKVTDNKVLEKAHGVAFNFTLSVFPTIIFFFALLPYVSAYFPSISQGEILHFFQDIMPKSVFEVTAETIHDTITFRRQGLLSFGVLFALFLATNGVTALMQAFNRSYKTVENRTYFKTRLIALFLTVILAFALILAITLLIVGQIMLQWLVEIGMFKEDFIFYLIYALKYLVVFIAFYLVIASIYFWGPAIHDKWRFFSMGSVLATQRCVMVSIAFSYYVTSFGTYNKLYGSLGAIIALMIWQWLMSVVLLLGFEFNASIDRATNGLVYEREK